MKQYQAQESLKEVLRSDEYVVEILKSPSSSVDSGRALVVRVRGSGGARIIKLYPLTDAPYCTSEYSRTSFLHNALADAGVSTAEPIELRSGSRWIAGMYSYVEGKCLSTFESPMQRTGYIMEAITMLAAVTRVPTASHRLEYSSDQATHYWSIDHGACGLPSLGACDYLQEWEAVCQHVESGHAEASELVQAVTAHARAAGGSSSHPGRLIHGDLNSDNVVVTESSLHLVDCGFAAVGDVFYEWGGLGAHLGVDGYDHVERQALRWAQEEGGSASPEKFALFTGLRALRRAAYLCDMRKRRGMDQHYIHEHLARQFETLRLVQGRLDGP